MNKLIFLCCICFSFLFTNCISSSSSNNDTKVEEEDQIQLHLSNQEPETEELYQPTERRFKYLFFANGGMLGFYADGNVVGCPRCEPDENRNYDFMFDRMPHTTYIETEDKIILEDGSELDLFYNGKIESDWFVFNYRPVEYLSALTNFETYTRQIPQDSILQINKTVLILFYPVAQTFEDEGSEEAQDYYEGMDDLIYYLSETEARFNLLGIESIVPDRSDKRYLQVEIENKEQILIDTYAPQNGWFVHALLYRKGHIPIVVDIVENDMSGYESYLDFIQQSSGR